MANVIYKGRRGGGAIALWTPTQTTTDAWIDLGDSTKIADTGTLTISDQVNNVALIQSNSSSKPSNTGGAYFFDGTDDFLGFLTPIPQYSGQSIYVVADTELLSTSDRLFLQRTIVSPDPPYPPGLYFGVSIGNYRPSFYWGNNYMATQSTERRGLNVFRFYIESNQSTTAKAITEVNGGSTVTSVMSGVFPLTAWNFVNFNLLQQSRVFIKEIIISGSSETDKIIGYLCHRHGLNYKMPSSHPYKNSPPTI